jgi:membrane-bound lytic murein transglycosylase MltF
MGMHTKKRTIRHIVTRGAGLSSKNFILSLFCLVTVSCGDESATGADELAVQDLSIRANSTVESVAQLSPAISAQDSTEIDTAAKNAQTGQLGFEILARKRKGDLDTMEKNRVIRVLTVYGLGRYFLDGPQEKGLTFELFKQFEQFINDRLGKDHLKLHVMFLPVSRDELIPALIEGRGDIVAAGLTITAERDSLIDFTDPASKKISEVLVTGPAAPPVKHINDLAGQRIYVRASSSYRSSLDELNRNFDKEGKEPIQLEDAREVLEDEDFMEMVNAGLINWAVVDDYKAHSWENVLENIVVRDDIVFREGGQIAFAVREDSPNLKVALNEFLKTHRQGTLKGNILFNRYVRDFDWADNALAAEDYRRFQSVISIFQTFGEQYGVDYLMVAAQGYQESRLDQNAKSSAGAIGIMQLLPSTAKDPNVGIPDISTAESNIHAGVKYLDFIRKRYFSDPEIDRFNKTMFAFAAYNAGPARIRKLRDRAAKAGYDRNKWFDNVEIFAARDIGRETVEYVANILKYYVAYRLAVQQQTKRQEARESSGVG